jgi:hypothetical protein
MRRLITALVFVAALAALGACGASEEQQVRDTVDRFVKAETQGDFARLCDLYTDELRAEQGKDCATTLASRQKPPISSITIVDIRVRNDRATADLDVSVKSEPPSRISLLLTKANGDWRVASGGT